MKSRLICIFPTIDVILTQSGFQENEPHSSVFNEKTYVPQNNSRSPQYQNYYELFSTPIFELIVKRYRQEGWILKNYYFLDNQLFFYLVSADNLLPDSTITFRKIISFETSSCLCEQCHFLHSKLWVPQDEFGSITTFSNQEIDTLVQNFESDNWQIQNIASFNVGTKIFNSNFTFFLAKHLD